MEKLLEDISKKSFDKQKYVDMIISEEELRDFLVDNMIHHPEIMKYYHCFYIVEVASSLKPELFYKYWDDLHKLLFHSNSYHRDFGLIILTNIAKADKENKFNDIIDDYMGLLNDIKYSTASYCVRSCAIVASVKQELLEKIVNRLLNLENDNPFPEKQKALMMSDIIKGLELVINIYPNRDILLNFVKKHISSISPKTRKAAKEFINNYS
ncbi:MAG: hypothetical protein ACFFAO_00395 [Candidatus Hermodarchaeota archaeon]